METTREILTAVNSFTAFQLGYNLDFIDECFADRPDRFIEHMQAKFALCYERWGSPAAMLMFWADLSHPNRETLLEYILRKSDKGDSGTATGSTI